MINATNLTTSVQIKGIMGMDFNPNHHEWQSSKPRSYAFICTEKNTNEKSQQKRLVEFGRRLPGDFAVRFQNDYSNQGKLRLDFNDPQIKIHYVLINVNVSLYWKFH